MNRDIQSEQKLFELLHDCTFFQDAICYDCLPSTNDLAKELAARGAPQGTVVLAESQTQGRGRMGRHFYSPKGHGLYMSLILRPDAQQNNAGLLTACGAVAAQQAILKLTGVSVSIKWVNDLYYQNKKLCGILAEGHVSESGTLDSVILGIGINITPPKEGYAAEIAGKTISVSEFVPQEPDRLALCAAIVHQWADFYHKLPETGFLEIYRKASCVLGKTVRFIQNGNMQIGTAVDIDQQARLVVRLSNGEQTTLGTGEISLLGSFL